jgi:DNA-3-methyladenine glycosylase II
MRKLGLSGQKTLYIRELARHTQKGSVVFEHLHTSEDTVVIEHLTQVKGIGVWTAQMFLMFALRRPNVLPVADLGIRVAMKKAYNLEDLPKPAEMEKIAAAWKPYTSIACWYLWRSLDNVGAL